MENETKLKDYSNRHPFADADIDMQFDDEELLNRLIVFVNAKKINRLTLKKLQLHKDGTTTNLNRSHRMANGVTENTQAINL